MSALDIFVIVLLGGGALIGVVRGLVHEILSLMAWVVAIVMLRLFHSPISVSLTEPVGTATGAAVIAFLCSPAAGYVNGASLAVDGGRMQSI